MNIRIGNDILLSVSLTDFDEHALTIKSAHATLINSTKRDRIAEILEQRRFPSEPLIDAYSPNDRQINLSGGYIYNVLPKNVVLKKHKLGHNVEVVSISSNSIDILFKAADQHDLGVYDLILTALIEDQTYPGGVRTITVDKPNLFQLVGTSDESASTSTPTTVVIKVDVDETIPTGDTYECTIMSSEYDPQDPFVMISEDGSMLFTKDKSGYPGISVHFPSVSDEMSIVGEAGAYSIHLTSPQVDTDANLAIICWDDDEYIKSISFDAINKDTGTSNRIRIDLMDDPETSTVVRTVWAWKDTGVSLNYTFSRNTNAVCLNMTIPSGETAQTWSLDITELKIVLEKRS